ncbi:unnamed protein product [Nesidiocoris tenuis]|uniref:Uncharacterized protein n=1 Tax=Nesidiocoris tenuis TaxID=355587 RepID=A0A6H5G3T8_9HEMI|nr:unnamed protein product [Nesidiocoris tenuis]
MLALHTWIRELSLTGVIKFCFRQFQTARFWRGILRAADGPELSITRGSIEGLRCTIDTPVGEPVLPRFEIWRSCQSSSGNFHNRIGFSFLHRLRKSRVIDCNQNTATK